ncbi:MAG: protein kinase [Gemmatimonadota bacterium]|nr:protein kinase [Gemmatimonadota bacterium]
MSDDAASAEALQRRVEGAVGAIFDVEEEIGRGGMAVVYRAVDKRLRRKVALKVLPPDLAFRADVRSRFVREAQMAARLSHPHIVPIYAVDETNGIVWFAMGLVEGEPLAKQLAERPRPDIATVRRVLREVADGLSYAHAQGVVHRDIKPDNILIDAASGRALVTDFGIARAAEGDLRLTATGVAVGTPAYMSPEQAMGEKDVDGRADIYALGIVGWQMLAGELPFKSENTPGMLMKHISEQPRPLGEMRDGVPENLVYAIERAMAKGRNDRWPDAAAFRDALADQASAPARLPDEASGARRGGSSAKPWRFDPLRDDALQSTSGAEALRKWREERRAWRERNKPATGDAEPLTRRERRELEREDRAERRAAMTPEDRVRNVQRSAASYVFTVGFLAAINFFTSPQFPWFIFPALGMGIGLMSKLSGLWIDGIPISRLFRRQPPSDREGAAESALPRGSRRQRVLAGQREHTRLPAPDLSGVPRDVLDGPHGATVKEAAEAKVIIGDVIARLPEHDRLSLPDVKSTAVALEERIRALAGAMHQLDRDASPEAMRRLEQKLADARASSSDSAERERRVGLLERQQSTLKDLAERRNQVASQLENSAILLQTMKLDLLKLRSSAMESNIADSTLATQEARVVSTDIERLVDAANEVRKLQR